MGVRIDTNGARRTTHEVERKASAVARSIALAHSEHFVRAIHLTSRRDTRRYVRGWQMAGRDLGVWDVVEPVRPSASAERHIETLEKQIARLEKSIGILEKDAKEKRRLFDLWFTSRGRKVTPKGRQMLRRAARAEDRAKVLYELLGRAERELEKYLASPGAIVFYAARGARSRAKANLDGTKRKSTRRRLTTVRDKVYGGTGRIIFSGATARVTLHNKEAHTSLVERRYHTVREARRVAQQTAPARRLGAKALGELGLEGGSGRSAGRKI